MLLRGRKEKEKDMSVKYDFCVERECACVISVVVCYTREKPCHVVNLKKQISLYFVSSVNELNYKVSRRCQVGRQMSCQHPAFAGSSMRVLRHGK